ncbi:MAG: helix-turn-helix domain-containing protein [Methylovirgula sp.]
MTKIARPRTKTDSNTLSARAKEVGERISELREHAGLSTSDLAAKMGISEVAVRKIQSGASTVQFVKLDRLCRLLGVTPNDVLGFNAGYDQSAFRGALEATFAALNIAEPRARQLIETIQEALDTPPIRSAVVDAETSVRVITETSIRRLLSAKER